MEKILFVLAGVSAVGKTTLLQRALRHRLPIFGADDNARFQTTALPSRFPERALPFAERLCQGTWFGLADLKELTAQRDQLSQVVLHVDILHLLLTLHGLDPDRQMDRARNEKTYREVLAWDFFRGFDRVLVNTLYAPWEQVADQFHRRRERERRANPMKLPYFDLEAPRKDVHAALYAAWLRAIEALNPHAAFLTRMQGDRIVSSPLARHEEWSALLPSMAAALSAASTSRKPAGSGQPV